MINKVIEVGRVTKDVEVSKTQNGKSVAKFILAVNRPYKDAPADFIPCKAFDTKADYLGRYAKQGAVVGVVGRWVTGKYENQEGYTVYTHELVADNVVIISANNANTEATTEVNDNYYTDDNYYQYPF